MLDSVENLTRYECGGPLLSGGEPRMYAQSNGEYVLRREAIEASSNRSGQVKDQVRRLVIEWRSFELTTSQLINRLERLCAEGSEG